MSNAREEILKQTVLDLKNTVNSVMLEINLKLSRPENIDNIAGVIHDLIIRLSIAENALLLATNLYGQSFIKQPSSEPETNENTSEKC